MDMYEVLKRYFGYDGFRNGQEDLIGAILSGRDVLGIMPTGAGKSICYQVPALLLPGITVVISPLISLMKDQVRALNEAGIHAAYINSSLTEGQIYKAMEYAVQGRYKIIYVAPERLLTPLFLDFAQRVQISMVTVDEARLYFPVGTGFPAELSEYCGVCESAGGAAGGECVYGDGNGAGAGRYFVCAGASESEGAGDGV